MMDIDEVVETSDAEEFEEMKARTREMAKTQARNSINIHYSDQGLSPPRKKPKHYHGPDEENIQTLSPIKSESINANSPRRSPSFSTTFATTSPSPLFTSRSPTRTPGLHTRVMPMTKYEEEESRIDLFAPPEDSQDPLLLFSPMRPLPSTPARQAVSLVNSPHKTLSTNTPQTFTPINSPPGPRIQVLPVNLFPLPRLMFPRTPLGIKDNDSSLNSSQNVVEEKIDEHLKFTPAKVISEPLYSSPLRPAIVDSPSPASARIDPRKRSQSRSPTPPFSRSASPDPPLQTVTEEPVAQEDASVALAQALDEQSRYSLRTRKIAQLKPFTTENMIYKRQMRAIPEAIVKNKALRENHNHRHPEDRYEEDGETQHDGYIDDGTQAGDDTWEEMEQRRKRRSDVSQPASTSEHQTRYPAILQSLPDTDDEEEMQDTAREAYRVKKRMDKEKKAREQEERERKQRKEESRKAKRFPISKRDFILPGSTKVVTLDEETEDPPTARRTSNVPHSPDNAAALRDYFAQEDYEMSDQGHQGNYDGDLLPEPHLFSSPPPDNIIRNSYEDAIPVDSNEDEDEKMKSDGEHKREKTRSQSITSDTGIILDLEPKKKTILHRMMPAFMINKLVQESNSNKAAKQKQRRQQEPSRNSDGPDNLLPGQTRVQVSTNPIDNREIKGDSESEVEIVISSDSDSLSDSQVHVGGAESRDESDEESDTNDILSVYQRPNSQKLHMSGVIDLTNDHHSDSDGALPASAYTRRYKPIRRKGGAGRLRDPSAIDYMLARSSTAERNRRSSADPTSTFHRKRLKFTHDIVTGGARKIGHERQTLLSFPTNTKKEHRRSTKQQSGKQPKASGSHEDPEGEAIFDEWTGNGSDHEENRVVPVDRPTRRERKKMKQKRVKELGVYTFRPENRVITSGRRPGPVYITVDLEDEEFHKSLLPPSAGPSRKVHWSNHYKPPLVVRKLKPLDNRAASGEASSSKSSTSRVEMASDLGIPILHPGRSFGTSTYIKKGWLYELVKVGDGTQNAPMISSISLLNFYFDVDMGVEKLCSMLPKFCEDLLEFATGLPDPDSEVARMQWTSAMRIISQLTSWYLKIAGSEEAMALSNTVQTEFSRLVNQIEQTSVTFVDIPVLSVCWFLVEISARVRHHPNPSPAANLENFFKDSSSLLMRLLLQYGLNKTMQPLVDDVELDGTSVAHYSAELWVCLIHLLSVFLDEINKPKEHPFWTQLQEILVSRAETHKTGNPYGDSEDAWLTIYSVCALSQFSVHGMTVGQPHLPACWDVVLFGLQRIHLGKVPEDGNKTSQKYDNYLALIVNRCFHLWDRYKWSLKDSRSLFNQLGEIFRHRKFANLLHEKYEYPNFFRDTDWERLSSHNSNETAYTLYLKLIVQAIQELYATGRPWRQLLSLLIPMGTVPFSENPTGKEMSMFYNRMAALAVASDLDRSSLNERVEKARSYVDFSQVGYRLRLAVIRGMRNWGCLLVQRKMNIGAFADWIEEIAQILGRELTKCPDSNDSVHQSGGKSNRSELERLLSSLFGSVRKIIQYCAQYTCYPESSFLKSLRHVYGQKMLDFNAPVGVVVKEFILLMNAYLDARSKALPPPPRPPLLAPLPTAVDEDSQESQDFGLTDDLANLDWTDVDLPEALVSPGNPSTEAADATAKNEENFREVLKTTPLKWTILRGLRPLLEGSKKGVSLCDHWLRIWLGCIAIEAQSTAWTKSFDILDDALNKCTDQHWTRRVQLSIMFQTLRIDPMQYTTYTDRAFGVFLSTLVSDTNILEAGKSDKPTVEREYVSFLLSIDGRHPLLLNATTLPARSEQSGDYELTAEQLLALRIPLLQGIFKNLNKLICQERAGNPEVPVDVHHYVTLCQDMFSAMRNNLSRLSRIPELADKFTKYSDFCHETLDVLKGNRELCGMESMLFWATWRP